jgi:hypothetical protein
MTQPMLWRVDHSPVGGVFRAPWRFVTGLRATLNKPLKR